MKIVALLLIGGAAHADTPSTRSTAVEVDRADAPAGRVELGFDGGAPLPGWGASIGVGLLDKPLVLNGDPPVRLRETVVLGGALAIGERVVLDLRVPMSRQVGDGMTRYNLGDTRLAARVRIAGDAGTAVLLRGALTFPTGDDGDYAGDLHWSAQWNLIGRATIGDVVLAASAGIHLRGAEVAIGDRVVGDEVVYAAGAVVPLGPLALTGEIVGAIGDKSADIRGPSPVEADGGVIWHALPELTIGVRGGAGLDAQLGSPAWRAMLEVAWQGDWRVTLPTLGTSDDDQE